MLAPCPTVTDRVLDDCSIWQSAQAIRDALDDRPMFPRPYARRGDLLAHAHHLHTLGEAVRRYVQAITGSINDHTSSGRIIATMHGMADDIGDIVGAIAAMAEQEHGV